VGGPMNSSNGRYGFSAKVECPYRILMLAARITLPHYSVSSAMFGEPICPGQLSERRERKREAEELGVSRSRTSSILVGCCSDMWPFTGSSRATSSAVRPGWSGNLLSFRRGGADFVVLGRLAPSAAQPQLEAIEIEIDDRRSVKGEKLAEREAADEHCLRHPTLCYVHRRPREGVHGAIRKNLSDELRVSEE
jgi:hypothetical protein